MIRVGRPITDIHRRYCAVYSILQYAKLDYCKCLFVCVCSKDNGDQNLSRFLGVVTNQVAQIKTSIRYYTVQSFDTLPLQPHRFT